MKLYGDFTKEDWLEVLEINEAAVPSTLILHGQWDHEENLSLWKEKLTNDQWIPSWNTVVGKHEGEQVGFSNVFGGPIAAAIAHRFAVMGTRTFIQTGYFGGLSHDVDYGDILIVTGAVMDDGVSQWYVPDQRMIDADQTFVQEAVRYCKEKGYRYTTGTVYSTGAIMVETQEMVQEWAKEGYLGVDMETATTFAVARKFNKSAVGLLNLSDHIIKGDTFYNSDDQRDISEEQTDQRIRELALHLSSYQP
ncbi:phosphorylase family protein [Thalassobacillus hwangdonensis]|uniref:Uridine phosphorylase n=1 Tax=Thalassobacillus hwangdonensis TaxID=546108 RepID=A0ABW3L1Z8_9BACI